MTQLHAVALLCGLVAVPMLSAQESPTPAELDDSDEVIERILELREEIESLLETLPSELRQEVERRWRERIEGAPAEAEAEPSPGETAEPSPPDMAEPSAATPTAVDAVATESSGDTAVEPGCGTLSPLDSNLDGTLSAGDRYWRHLRLWFDDGDAELAEAEIESLFELGIREIDLALRSYKDPDGAVGDVYVDEVVRLRLFGKGRGAGREGVLVLAADRLARGGELWLVNADGARPSGYQPLGNDLAIESADGGRWSLLCR